MEIHSSHHWSRLCCPNHHRPKNPRYIYKTNTPRNRRGEWYRTYVHYESDLTSLETEMNIHSSNVESPLLAPSTPTSDSQLPLRELLSNTSMRGPTLLCAGMMALQQFGGINAVMFYSTPVLRPLLPDAAGLLGIGITLVNAIMTLPAIFLVDVSPSYSCQMYG